MSPRRREPAQVIIRRPDGTETRFVRRKGGSVSTRMEVDGLKRDEDREAVLACPPYTASFNALLKERREKNSRVLVNAVLERMQAEAIPLNVVTYNLLMERVVCFPDDIIFMLYDGIREEAMKEDSGVQPNLTTYQLLFRACERKGQYNRAFLFYKQMRDIMRITPDSPTYDTLLGFCAAVKDVAQAMYFLEEMKRDHLTPDVNTYNCLLSVLGDNAPYEETLRVFQQMLQEGIKPTTRTYNMVCQAARTHGDFDRAFQFFEEMKKRGMLPDVITYNTLFCLIEHRLEYVMGCGAYKHIHRTFEQKKHDKKTIVQLVLGLFDEMESVGQQPNTFSYNQVMTILLKCGDHRVFSIYRRLKDYCKVKQDELLILGKRETKKKRGLKFLSEARKADGSCDGDGSYRSEMSVSGEEEIVSLDEMMGMEDLKRPARISASNAAPNRDTYRIIVRACLELGLADRCYHFYHVMRDEGFLLDHDFAILMENVCEVNKDKSRALSVLEDAKEARLFIDAKLFNAYLNVLASLGDTELISIVEEMKIGIHAYNVQADVDTFNTLLRGYFCMGDHVKMAEVFSSMYFSYSQVSPNAETYSWILRSYAQTHDTEAATQLLQSMRQRNVQVLIQHYNGLMQVYLEASDARILEVFHMLVSSDSAENLPKPNAESFCLAMQYHLRQQEWEKLEALFMKIKAEQIACVDTSCYNVMLEMALIRGKEAYAKTLHSEIHMKCITPDLKMYNTLLRIFALAGDTAMYTVLCDMKTDHVEPDPSTLGILLEYAEGRRLLSTAVERGLFWNPVEVLEGLI